MADAEDFRGLLRLGSAHAGKKCSGGDEKVSALDAMHAVCPLGMIAGKSTLH